MRILIFVFIYLSTNIIFAAEFSLNKKDGLFEVKNNDGIFINSKYIGWAPNWKWDGPKVLYKNSNENKIELNLEFKKQEIKSNVKVEINKDNIKYYFYHQFNKEHFNTIGGGIEFNFDLRSQIQINGAKSPYILPDKTGWRWEFKPNQVVKVDFSRSISKIYFEKGNKSKIRAMFFSGNIKKGHEKTVMTITIPSGSSVLPFNNADTTQKKHSSWLENSIDPLTSFVDLSYLNDKPAGKHGFVRAVGNKFVFSDNTPIRFYGTNIQAHTLFIKNKRLIKQHAKRIAKLGFNLVRLHHHDSPWVSSSLISKGSTTQNINLKSLDSYFWWVKCLRDEGIYIWMDLQVQRPWRKGDLIPGWETDMAPKAVKGMSISKGFIYLNKRMQELSKKFNEELLSRVNPYTQLALKDDPAVMGLMITNENDLTLHLGNTFLKNKGHPYHQSLFDKEVEKFANKFSLSAYKVRETWKPGVSKYLLNDLEARFNKDMLNHLRNIGVKVPVSTTSLWGRNSRLFSLPALTTGNMVDAHGYADSGIFNKSLLQKNPHFEANFLHGIGQAQVVGKPFTVSEYNVGEHSKLDNSYIATVSVASMAAFQGWDAIMLYGYSQDALKGGRTSPWSSYTHPAIMGVIPAMALLYREGHVAPAKKTVVLAPANDELFTKNLSSITSVAIRTSLEQHRMLVAMPKIKKLPWLQPSNIDKNAIVIHDLQKSILPENQNFIVSDTGEIKRNWREGIMTINTDKSQLVMGRIGGREITLEDVIVKVRNSEAAIIFTSMDKKPIRRSKQILISAVAKVRKVKHQRKSSYISEPVIAEISFSSIHKGLRVVALQPDGSEGRSISLSINKNGVYSFVLSEKDKTHWYVIRD